MRFRELLLKRLEEDIGFGAEHGGYWHPIVFTLVMPIESTIKFGEPILPPSMNFAATSRTPHLIIEMLADAERETQYSFSSVERTTPKNVRYLRIQPDEFFFLF